MFPITLRGAEVHGWDTQSTYVAYASKCQKLQMFVYKRKQKIKKKTLKSTLLNRLSKQSAASKQASKSRNRT